MTTTEAEGVGELPHEGSSAGDEPGTPVARTVEWLAAALSLTVGAVHFGYAPHHLADDWAHGWFFLLLGAFQIAFAVLVVARPRRWLWWSAVVVNLGTIATWTVSRTVGLPFGPQALRKEAASAPDILCVVVQGLIVALALVAAVRPEWLARPSRDRASLRFTALAVGSIAAVLGAVVLTPSYTAAHEAAGHSHSHSASEVATGDSPCELAGAAASSAQEEVDSEGHSHRGPTAQLPLTEAERQTLAQQQLLARQAVARYPTVADAEAAGYRKSTVYIPCIGAHYTNTRYVLKFDPANPSELLYDGTDPTSRIVGLSYLLFSPGGAPEGFAGPNDVWHQHNKNGGLCLKGGLVIGAESMSAEDCTARGGRKTGNVGIWMVHDWVAPGWECTWGVFAAECPELGGRIGGTAFDVPDGRTSAVLTAAN